SQFQRSPRANRFPCKRFFNRVVRTSERAGLQSVRRTSMAETWLAKLYALETHIFEAQKTKARETAETATWNRLRQELERIVPAPKGQLKIPFWVEGNSPEQAEPKSIFGEAAFWDEMRAEIETLRLRIPAEVEAYRSRNPAAGPYPPKQS